MTVQEAVRALERAGWTTAGRPVAGAYVAEATAGGRRVGVAAGSPEVAWPELWRWVVSGRHAAAGRDPTGGAGASGPAGSIKNR